MFGDALQDIDEVGMHDTVQTAGDGQRLDDAKVLGAEFGPAEIPVLTPPIGTTLSSRWFVSNGTSGSIRSGSSPGRRSRV